MRSLNRISKTNSITWHSQQTNSDLIIQQGTGVVQDRWHAIVSTNNVSVLSNIFAARIIWNCITLIQLALADFGYISWWRNPFNIFKQLLYMWTSFEFKTNQTIHPDCSVYFFWYDCLPLAWKCSQFPLTAEWQWHDSPNNIFISFDEKVGLLTTGT